jgi:hypothetical protein
MLIEWLIPMKTSEIKNLTRSNLASVRLRAAVGAAAVEESGANNQFTDGFETKLPNVLVIGKVDNISDPQRAKRWTSRIASAKKKARTKIILDYTDHHLAGNSANSIFYRNILQFSDHVVCSSSMLAKHMSEQYAGQISVIEDPIEVPIQTPKSKRNAIPTALWFGHSTNLPYLIDFLTNRYQFSEPARLILMTNLYPMPTEVKRLLDKDNLKLLEINAIQWSLKDMVTAASLADVCWIPAGLNDARKSGASSNRLLTAIALGLPTAADRLDSYNDFKQFFIDLDDQNFNNQLKNPDHYFETIEAGQQIILEEFTGSKIGKKWTGLIKNLMNSN